MKIESAEVLANPVEQNEVAKPKSGLKPEIKSKWIAALRSGEYPQCKGALHTEVGFDSLGVLCDLYLKETNQQWISKQGLTNELLSNLTDVHYSCMGSSLTFPIAVQKWSGLDHKLGAVLTVEEGPSHLMRPMIPEKYKIIDFTRLNDMGCTLPQIADIVEAYL